MRTHRSIFPLSLVCLPFEERYGPRCGSPKGKDRDRYDSFSFVQLQGKHCTKKAFLNENPYEKAFFSTMLALKKALKGKK